MKINSFVGISNAVKTVGKMTIIVMVVAYFLFHAINGENGLLAYVKTRKLLGEQSVQLEMLQTDLDILKRDVELLSNSSIDLDLLEERCRIILNYSYPEDYVVRTKTVLS